MKEKNSRTLYECSNARVNSSRTLCRKGHRLIERTEDGSIDSKRLARGEPLVYRVCQECVDFDCMGPPVPSEERGWLKNQGAK